jgi:hypothetical protein
MLFLKTQICSFYGLDYQNMSLDQCANRARNAYMPAIALPLYVKVEWNQIRECCHEPTSLKHAS